MKKIFAIALALVMVLSMASAFASACTTGFDWTCATSKTYCGQGTVELVPYVKVNNGCGGYDWQVSECASAVSSEKVFYALKLTVDADADEDWWKQAKVELTYKGMAAAAPAVDKPWSDVKKAIKVEDTADEVNVFYYDFKAKAWEIVDDDFELNIKENYHVKAEVVGNKAADAKICVELKSEMPKFTKGLVGNYWVVYNTAVNGVEASPDTIVATFKGDVVVAKKTGWTMTSVVEDGNTTVVAVADKAQGKVLTDTDMEKIVTAKDAAGASVTATNFEFIPAVEADAGELEALEVYTKDGKTLLAKYYVVDGKVRYIDTYEVCGEDSWATIKAFFGLDFGTCLDQDLVNANFGWKTVQKDCFEWSDKAASIVDAECVVAIPKTGDKGLLWWLF